MLRSATGTLPGTPPPLTLGQGSRRRPQLHSLHGEADLIEISFKRFTPFFVAINGSQFLTEI